MPHPLRALAALPVLAALSACVSATDPIGPYSPVQSFNLVGSQTMVICTTEPDNCETRAALACPSGYEIQSETINAPDSWRKSLVIKCDSDHHHH